MINRIKSTYYQYAYVYFSVCPPVHKVSYYVIQPIRLKMKNLKDKKGNA